MTMKKYKRLKIKRHVWSRVQTSKILINVDYARPKGELGHNTLMLKNLRCPNPSLPLGCFKVLESLQPATYKLTKKIEI
jgi:hypothetical protein